MSNSQKMEDVDEGSPVRATAAKPISSTKPGVGTAAGRVYAACGQEGPLHWEQAFPRNIFKNSRKVGEGSYAEVFSTKDDEGEDLVLKIVPIEGEGQLSFASILPEMSISVAMSRLKNNVDYATPNFVEVKRVVCVKGTYPARLIQAWEAYCAKKATENDPPIFPDQQLFVVFVFANAGYDLEHAKLNSYKQANSIVTQIAITLAIAEIELEFEHRDLHIGNVLIKQTKNAEIEYLFDGKPISIKSHGVHVFIIDFTLSRSCQGKEGLWQQSFTHAPEGIVYTNLAYDAALFRGEGDFQYDIYRMMRDLNGNEWKSFNPKTNVFWIQYLIDKLINFKKYAGNRPITAKQAAPLTDLCKGIELFTSSQQLIRNHEHFGELSIEKEAVLLRRLRQEQLRSLKTADDLKRQLDEVAEEREGQDRSLQAIRHERDNYKRLLTHAQTERDVAVQHAQAQVTRAEADTVSVKNAFDKLRAEFDLYRAEKQEAEKLLHDRIDKFEATMADVRSDREKDNEEVNRLKAANARLQAQLQQSRSREAMAQEEVQIARKDQQPQQMVAVRQPAPNATASGSSTPRRARENAGPSGGKRVAARKPVTRQTPVAATPKPPPAEKEKASGKKRTPLPRRAAAAAASAFRVDDGSEEDDQPSTSKSGKKKTPHPHRLCPDCKTNSTPEWRYFNNILYCNACEHRKKREQVNVC